MAQKDKTKKTVKKTVFKRPNINLLATMAVLLLTLTLAVFQLQQVQDPRSRAAALDCTVTSPQMLITAQERALFDKINEYRVQQGRDKLVWQNNMNQAATWLGLDMVRTGVVSHIDSLGRLPDARFPDCGATYTRNYGEIVSVGSPNADQILAVWKSNPADNAALLNATYEQAAVAAQVNGTTAYWVYTALGQPQPTNAGQPPVATATRMPIVTEGPLDPTVPSPVCLGGCPTLVPPVEGGGNPPGQGPVATTVPAPTTAGQQPENPGIEPTVDPANPTPIGGVPPGENPPGATEPGTTPPDGGNQGGIIGLFLSLLALIIGFFLSLFGR